MDNGRGQQPGYRPGTGPHTGGEDYEKRRRSRNMHKALQRFVVLFGSLAAILLVAWVITLLVQSGRKGGGTVSTAMPDSSAGVATSQPQQGAADPAATANVEQTQWNFIGPVEQTINEMQLLTPDYRMFALPENGRVDMSYFNTVTFVGDSLTQGLEIYKQGVPNAHYCAYKGIGPKQMYDGSVQRRNDGTQEVPLEALAASAPDNVYIQLGANAMVYLDDESIIAYYREMLAHMREVLDPAVTYYVQSITPVRPDNQPGFDMPRIHTLNNLLAQMAFEEQVHFLDLTEALAGDDSYLREDFSSKDGYHMSPSGYAAWVEYLVTHTAYHPRNPYLEGSGYTKPAPAPAEEPAPEETTAEEAPAETPPEAADPAAEATPEPAA